MTGLLMKDWKLLQRQGRYFGIVLLVMCAIAFTGSKEYTSFITSYLTFMVSIFSFSSFSYDEFENGMGFLISLPCGRQNYVRAKYMFSFLLITGGWLIGVLVRIAFFLVRFSWTEYLEYLPSEPIYPLICLFYVGCALPVMIKFGSEKGRNMVFSLLAIVAVGVFLAAKSGIGLSSLKTFVQAIEPHPVLALSVLGIACMIIWAVSYQISLKLIEKKEF